MKKRWLSVISIVLIICMLLPMALACGKKENNKDNSDTNTVTNTGTNTGTGNTNTGTGNTNTGTGNTNTGSGNTNTGTGGTGTDEDGKTGSASVLESQSAPVVKYLRIAEIGENSVTIKFNIVGEITGYEIKQSNKEITEKNYSKATDVTEYEISGDGNIKTVVIPNLSVGRDNVAYIAVKANNDFASSTMNTVRAGGIYMIDIDHKNPQQLGNGETNRDLTNLIDEQDIVGDPYRDDFDDLPATRVPQFWDEAGTEYHNTTTTTTAERFGTQLAPIIDLLYVHYVDNVMLYYSSMTYDVIVRVSKDAANFNTPEDWDEIYYLKRNTDRIVADLDTYITVLLDEGRETSSLHAHVTMKEYNHFVEGLGTAWFEIHENKDLSEAEKNAQKAALINAEVAFQKQYFETLITALKAQEATKALGEAIDALYQDSIQKDANNEFASQSAKLKEDILKELTSIREQSIANSEYRESFETALSAAISTTDKICYVGKDDIPTHAKTLLKEFAASFDYQMLETYAFNKVDFDRDARYVQVEFKDGEAPSEVLVYGYAIGEDENMMIQDKVHERPTIGEMMGQCGFVAGGGGNCTIEQLACSYVIREYHNVGWSYSTGSFPGKAVSLANTVVGDFDSAYKRYSEAGFLVIPCLQWNESSSPARVYDELEGKLSGTIATWEEKYLPQNYAAYADLIYQYSARYGSSKMGYLVENMIAHSDAVPGATAGRGYIEWIELGNEPNGEDAAGATPYQLAALTSAAYDGHQRTLLSHIYNPNSFSYPFGGKNADPDIKLAIAGLAGIQNRYIMSMAYWMRANRTDGSIAMDAFNVHTYFGKYFYMNDQSIIVGVSPEEFGLVDAMSDLVGFRDKYYPDVEVWLTEFGWDTNQSYETMTSAHAYNTKDLNGDGEISEYEKVMRAREIQGMWLVRAYILLSSCGVDKATMYMCEDTSNTDETTAIGKYGTCGIWATARTDNDEFYRVYDATWYDAEGKKTDTVFEVYVVSTVVTKEDGTKETVDKYYRVDNDEEVTIRTNEKTKEVVTIEDKMEAKDGYYYMYTLKNAIGDMRFVKEIYSGNEDVWVYEFADGKGKVGYAVWCPTSNGTVVENFKLTIDGSQATLIESDSKNKDIDGVSTNLQITDNTVTITVSENPVYVIVK